MKGAIEYLRAVRDICTARDCDECPVINVCPFMGQPPKAYTDDDIVDMIRITEKALAQVKAEDEAE